MKNLFKIIFPFVIAFTMVSCMTTSNPYASNVDPYSQGYSDGYRDGYYQAPDGFWYAPNVVYLDYNNTYYRNGAVYNSPVRGRRDIIISPRRNSQNSNLNGTRVQTQSARGRNTNGIRNQNNIRVLPNSNTGTRNQLQNNIRVQPNRSTSTRSQPQNNIQTQPQGTRSGSQGNIRTQPQSAQENLSPRPSGSR